MSANQENCCDTALELEDKFIDLQNHFNDICKHTSLKLNSLTSQVNHLRKSAHFERKQTQQVIANNQRLKIRILSLKRTVRRLENLPQEPSSSSSEEEEQEEENQDGDCSDNSSVGVPAVVN